MSDSIRRNEVVERIRLTTVPRVKETPDNGLVLLCRCAHAEVLFLTSRRNRLRAVGAIGIGVSGSSIRV